MRRVLALALLGVLLLSACGKKETLVTPDAVEDTGILEEHSIYNQEVSDISLVHLGTVSDTSLIPLVDVSVPSDYILGCEFSYFEDDKLSHLTLEEGSTSRELITMLEEDYPTYLGNRVIVQDKSADEELKIEYTVHSCSGSGLTFDSLAESLACTHVDDSHLWKAAYSDFTDDGLMNVVLDIDQDSLVSISYTYKNTKLSEQQIVPLLCDTLTINNGVARGGVSASEEVEPEVEPEVTATETPEDVVNALYSPDVDVRFSFFGSDDDVIISMPMSEELYYQGSWGKDQDVHYGGISEYIEETGGSLDSWYLNSMSISRYVTDGFGSDEVKYSVEHREIADSDISVDFDSSADMTEGDIIDVNGTRVRYAYTKDDSYTYIVTWVELQEKLVLLIEHTQHGDVDPSFVVNKICENLK